MSDVTLSSAVRSNLLSLQNTADMMAKTQERLATGLKVNSALDNPTNFFTASSLNSRAGDLGRLLDAVGNATQTLEAADNGISAITKLVESAQATARQAQQTSATSMKQPQPTVQHWPTTPPPPHRHTGLTGTNASDSIFTAG
jgi:flagellin